MYSKSRPRTSIRPVKVFEKVGARRQRRRLLLEALDHRALLTAYLVDTPNDVVANDGLISLREAIQAANTNAVSGDAQAGTTAGDQITFAASLTGQTMLLGLGEMTISESLVIDGENRNLTIDMGGQGRAFRIDGAGSIEMRNMTLVNGNVSDEGGAIWISNSSVVLDNVDVLNSTAAGDGGGAFHIFNSNVEIRNAVLSGNTATGALGSGGAIHMASGDVMIVATRIEDNTALRAGGGIEVVDGNVTLRTTSLRSNDAGSGGEGTPGNGGAIHVSGNSSSIRLEASYVTENTAAREGGGLWNQLGSVMTLLNSRVTDNVAMGDAADDGGGGIFNNGGTVVMDRSNVSDNRAEGTLGSGGGIFSTSGDLILTSSVVQRNTAFRAGGGIEIINGGLSMRSSSLRENIAGPLGNANPGNGGGLHVTGDSASVSIDSSYVIDNEAGREGGGLWNQAGSVMTVSNTRVITNHAHGDAADDGGGGVFNNGGSLIIQRTTLIGNTADGTAGSGGAILSLGGNVIVDSSGIDGNTANRAGGGVEIATGDLLLRLSSLRNNVAGPVGSTSAGNGGALHVTGAGANVRLDRSYVNANQAAGEGGALWNAAGSQLTVLSTRIFDNIAAGDATDQGGGAIYNDGGMLDINLSLISNNRASGDQGAGGGILSTDGNVRISGTVFDANVANGSGGGVSLVSGNLDVQSSSLRNNVAGEVGLAATSNGGAIYVSGNGAVRVDGSQLNNNTAGDSGGALWFAAGSLIDILNSTIRANQSLSSDLNAGGGGVFGNGGILNLNNVTLRENTSASAGGGIYGFGGGTMNLTNTDVAANSSVGNGGGIYSDGNFNSDDASFIRNNTSTGEGGGIYTDLNGVTDLALTQMFGNTPDNQAGPGTYL